MGPGEKGVVVSFFYYQRNSFYELGQIAASEIPAWDAINSSNLKGDSKVLLEDGHAYFFTIDDINGTGIQMVFQIERD